MSLRTITHNTWRIVGRNLPAILTGLSIVGVGATAFFTGKAMLESDKKIRKLEKENGKTLETKDKVAETYTYYVPAILAGLGTIACIFGANRLNAQQLAAVATVATTATKALDENREKVKELYGEKGLRKLDEKINEAHAMKYIGKNNTIYETGHGSTLICEGFLTGMFIHASPEWVKKCVNDYNKEVLSGRNMCWNEFIELLVPSIDPNILPSAGYCFGYNTDISNRLLEIVMDPGLTPDTNEPYIMVNVREFPLFDYKFYC